MKKLLFLLLLSSQIFCQDDWTYSNPTHDGEMSIEMIQIDDGSYLSISSVSTDSCRYIGGLVKFSLDGQIEWSKEYDNPENQLLQLYFRQIIETPDFLFIRAGSEYSAHGNIILKLDKQGNVIQNFVMSEELMGMTYYPEEDLLFIEHVVDLDLTNKGVAFALYSLDLELLNLKTSYQLGLPAFPDEAQINNDKSISAWRLEGDLRLFKTVTFDGEILAEAEVIGDDGPLYGGMNAAQLNENRWVIAPSGLFQISEENLSLFIIDTETGETKHTFQFGNDEITHVRDVWTIGNNIVVSIDGDNKESEYFYVFNQQLQLVGQFNLNTHLLDNTEEELGFHISKVNLNDDGALLIAGAPYIVSQMTGATVEGGYLNAVYPLFTELGISISSTIALEASSFSSYPNPASSHITISLDEHFIGGTFSLTDIQGRKVHQSKIEGESITHDLEDLAKGLYIITLTNGVDQKSEVLVVK